VSRSKGTQEASGIEYLAPRRPAEAVREDRFGWQGEQFQYPYAFDEKNYQVTYCPEGSPNPQNGPFPVPYAIYYMTEGGQRELLAYDPAVSCNSRCRWRRARFLRPAVAGGLHEGQGGVLCAGRERRAGGRGGGARHGEGGAGGRARVPCGRCLLQLHIGEAGR
jgi:hypothetical protein